MTLDLPVLALLALIDATSIGTLLIPGLLLIRPRPPYRGLLLYSATLYSFYFSVGAAGLLGLDLISRAAAVAESTAGQWAQLLIGLALFLWGVLSPTPDPEVSLTTWRRRLDRPLRARTAVGLGLTAGVIELAGMLPYLAALGIITGSDASPWVRILVLLGYCAVMFLIAGALFALRVLLGKRILTPLQRFTEWMFRQADSTVLWVAAILGFILASRAVASLFF